LKEEVKMKTRKSWKEKLHTDQEAKVVVIPEKMRKRFGSLRKNATILIPRPLDVDALIRRVPRGRLVTQGQLRERLARDAAADVACPITTGIFVRIVAEAAAEADRAGKSRITPYWRVVREDGRLLEKLPGGLVAQADRLEAEGHAIDRTGKLRVKELKLVKFR